VSVVGAGASSCCRRHSAPMQRQKRLMQVWSSSIDYPQKFNDNVLGKHVVLGFHPNVRADFRVFRLDFIPLSRIYSAFNLALTFAKDFNFRSSACAMSVLIRSTRTTC